MSQPSGDSPNGSVTAGAGLSAWSQKSANQWKTETTAPMKNSLETNFFGKWISNMFGGFFNGVLGLISALVYGLKGITGGLIDLTGALKATDQKADNAQNQANQAIENTSQVVQQVRAVLNSITAPFTESWMTQVPGQQVSFPDALLQRNPKRAADYTSSLVTPWTDRVTVDVSDTGGGRDWFTTFSTTFTPAANTLVAAYIQSNYAVGRATISIKTGAVTSPCALYVVVLRMLPSGDCEVAWVSPNQTPLMPLGKVEWDVTAPSDIPFDELEQMVIGVHQVGAGNVRPLAGIERDFYTRSAVSFPPQQAMNFPFSSVMTQGSVIAKGSQQFASNFLMWCGIGQRLYSGDPLPRTHTDDFSGTVLAWTKIGTANARILNGMFAYQSTTDLKSFYYYPQPLAYGDQRVEAFAANVNSRDQGMMCRGNAAGSSFFALVLDDGGAALRQWTAVGESSNTLLGSYSGPTSGTYWAIEAIGTVLTAYQRDTSGTWIPRIQIMGVGLQSGRYAGLFCDGALFGASGSWDNFYARDMVELQEAA